jgi:hypothetical protein
MSYRAYFANSNGSYIGVESLHECYNDAEAISAAEHLPRAQDIHIWEYNRKVATIPARSQERKVDPELFPKLAAYQAKRGSLI